MAELPDGVTITFSHNTVEYPTYDNGLTTYPDIITTTDFRTFGDPPADGYEALRDVFLQAQPYWNPAPDRAAQRRARKLLESFLSAKQLTSLKEHRWFWFKGQKHWWRLDANGSLRRGHRQTRMQRLLTGKEFAIDMYMCINPVDRVPPADEVLAKMLAVLADEDGVLRVANSAMVLSGEGTHFGDPYTVPGPQLTDTGLTWTYTYDEI